MARPYRARLKAGAGGVEITPAESIGMPGFGDADKRPSRGVYQKLYVKALTLDDGKSRAAILGGDMFRWPVYLTDHIRKRLRRSCGLRPGELFLNASHTHCGPMLAGPPTPYVESVIEKTVRLVETCLASSEKAQIFFGRGRCDIAWNRRRLDRDGHAYWGINPFGPVDHDVPVLQVVRPDGGVIAVVMSYACHPTTIADDFLGADYPGYARAFLEAKVPGATALFLQGCGSDTKPGRADRADPSQFDYGGGPPAARAMGERLGRAVLDALAGGMEEIEGPLLCGLRAIELPLIAPIQDGSRPAGPFRGSQRRLARLAKSILRSVDRKGNYNKTWPAMVQVITIGKKFVLAGISGEVATDIGLNIKARLAPRLAMVCGYTNQYQQDIEYIPSRHMIEEGGYESSIPFSPEMEDFLATRVIELCDKGRQP